MVLRTLCLEDITIRRLRNHYFSKRKKQRLMLVSLEPQNSAGLEQ